MKTQCLLIYLSVIFIYSECITRPNNMLSEMKRIYSKNYTSEKKNFNISFTKAFMNIPQICISLSQYQLKDHFYHQNLRIIMGQIKEYHFNISVVTILKLYRLSIHYLAIEQQINFFIFQKQYNNLTTLSQKQGNRSVLLTETHNYSSSIIKGQYFIIGFQIQSITDYSIRIQIVYITKKAFQLKMFTLSSCKVHRINLFFLFYYQYLIESKYWILSDLHSCFGNTTLVAQHINVNFIKESVFILGMNYLQGKISNKMINFGYEMLEIKNNQMILTFNTSDLTVCYSFMQITTLIPQYLPILPQNETKSLISQSSDTSLNVSIVILILAIISLSTVCLIASIIYKIFRSQWYNRYKVQRSYEMMKKKLSVIGMHELPSFS